MCQAILEMRMESEGKGEQSGEQRGIKMGELKSAQEIARRFYDMEIEVEKVARA